MDNTVTMKLEDYDKLKEKADIIENAVSLEIATTKKYIEVRLRTEEIYEVARQKLKDSGLMEENPQLVVVEKDSFYFFGASIAKEPKPTE